MTMRITIEKLRKWEACCSAPGQRYDDANLRRLFRGKPSLSLVEVLRKRSVPYEDRVWVATRPGAMTKRQIQAFCNCTADRAVRRHALHCGVEAAKAGPARAWAVMMAAREAAAGAAWAARRQQVRDLLRIVQGEEG